MMEVYYIFFSSRRRHTRYWRDWSSDVCSSDLDSLMNYGKVKRPVLGVRGQTVLSKDGKVKGFYVNEIVEGSAAAKSGIRPTDVITEIDGVSVQKFEDLAIVIDKHKIEIGRAHV